MDLDFLSLVQTGTLGVNTVMAVLLYKMHRDNAEQRAAARLHWHWIEKMRRAIWPEAFTKDDGREPHIEGP